MPVQCGQKRQKQRMQSLVTASTHHGLIVVEDVLLNECHRPRLRLLLLLLPRERGQRRRTQFTHACLHAHLRSGRSRTARQPRGRCRLGGRRGRRRDVEQEAGALRIDAANTGAGAKGKDTQAHLAHGTRVDMHSTETCTHFAMRCISAGLLRCTAGFGAAALRPPMEGPYIPRPCMPPVPWPCAPAPLRPPCASNCLRSEKARLLPDVSMRPLGRFSSALRAAPAWNEQYSQTRRLTGIVHGRPSLRSALQCPKSAAMPRRNTCDGFAILRHTSPFSALTLGVSRQMIDASDS